jgi:hypothetical protein
MVRKTWEEYKGFGKSLKDLERVKKTWKEFKRLGKRSKNSEEV